LVDRESVIRREYYTSPENRAKPSAAEAAAKLRIDDLAGGSDHRDRRFGRDWGILIEEHGLLPRAVFVIDRAGGLRYSEIVPEITSEPDYASALDVLFDLV